MRREQVQAPGSLTDLRCQLPEGSSNDKAQFEGRKLCLPFAISRMFRCLKWVGQLLEDGGRAPLR